MVDRVNKMVRSQKGLMVHNSLIEEATRMLEKEGYKVRKNYGIVGKFFVDVAGFKDDKKVAVECIVKPTKSMIESLAEKLKKYFDKVIFYVPKGVSIEVPSTCKLIVSENVEYKDKYFTIKVSEDTLKRLRMYQAEMVRQSHGEVDYTLDDVINALLNLMEITYSR